MKIATLGPKGTFSHEAVLSYAKNAHISFKHTIWEVFESVDMDECEIGIVPVENTVGGTIGLTLDALMQFELSIVRELVLLVNHNLVACKKVPLDKIKTLYCHPQAFAQCELFHRRYLEGVEVVQTSSTAKSAAIVHKKKDPTKAALVSKTAAKIYALSILKERIQDNKFNMTRFIIVSKHKNGKKRPKTSYKTSIAIYPTVDRPGLLHSLLGHFAKQKLNLTKIESRPTKGKLGDYIFFIDFLGHDQEESVKKAFKALKKVAYLKVFGSYPF